MKTYQVLILLLYTSGVNMLGQPEQNNVVAWLILGYLCSHPDAKDTVVGVEKWWLQPEGVEVSTRQVQSTLDGLVEWGWLTSMTSPSTVTVYGLNKACLSLLRRLLQGQSSTH